MKKIILKTINLVSVLLLVAITSSLLSSTTVLAEAGSRLANCTDMKNEDARNTCLRNLENNATQACLNSPDVENCRRNWMNEKVNGGISGSSIPEDDPSINCKPEGGAELSSSNCGIVRYLVIIINTLSALAGIAIIGSIVYGGIQYSASGSDPQKVGAAKDRIRNAFIALILFIFGYAIVNYLVPGGIL